MRLLTVATQIVLWSGIAVLSRLCWRMCRDDLHAWFLTQARRGVARRHRRVSAVEQTRMLDHYRGRAV